MSSAIPKLRKAITKTGGQAALAERLSEITNRTVGQSHISMWLHRKTIPPEWVIPLEKALSGKVTRYDIRPDLYPRDHSLPA